MHSLSELKKFIVYSLAFHAVIFLVLVIYGATQVITPLPATQVTMIRLTRGTGDLQNPLTTKSGGQSGTTSSAQAKPTAEPPKPVSSPAKPTSPKKPEPPKLVDKKPTPKKPAAKIEAQKTPALVTQKPKPAQPAQKADMNPIVKSQSPKIPTPDDRKIAEALGQVREELQQRETSAKSTASSRNSGSGAAAGSGESSSPGYGSPTGEIRAVDPEKARYGAAIRSKIIREWVRTSSGTETKVLRATVVVRINASGTVISKSISRGSGDASFDNSALRAVERASPFPPPSDLIKGEAINEGFVVMFNSRMLGRN